MKRLSTLIFISIIFLAASCSKDEGDMMPMEFNVDSYSNVSVDGQVKVIFNNENKLSKTGSTEFDVVIKSTSEQRKNIVIVSEDGVLKISVADGIVLEDNIEIALNTNEQVNEIKLESEQKAEFIGVFDQEALTVVTEAKSELSLVGARVNNLTTVTQGESLFTLSSWSDVIYGDIIFEENSAVLLNDSTLLADNSIFIGDIVEFDEVNNEWIVYGEGENEEIEQYFVFDSCDFKTEGNTRIYAENAVIKNVNIKLEGSSEAKVWAIDYISGFGKGESTLDYFGNPDISNFITEGSAQINSIN